MGQLRFYPNSSVCQSINHCVCDDWIHLVAESVRKMVRQAVCRLVVLVEWVDNGRSVVLVCPIE